MATTKPINQTIINWWKKIFSISGPNDMHEKHPNSLEISFKGFRLSLLSKTAHRAWCTSRCRKPWEILIATTKATRSSLILRFKLKLVRNQITYENMNTFSKVHLQSEKLNLLDAIILKVWIPDKRRSKCI